jgi:hypothetical protein
MRIELGLDQAKEALDEARGRRRYTRGGPVCTPSSSSSSQAVPQRQRSAPLDLRSATAARGGSVKQQLKFARFAARGLYQEADEHLRVLLHETFNGEGDNPNLAMRLLDDVPATGEEEKIVVLLYLDRYLVGCAFYCPPPPSELDGANDIRLLALSPQIMESAIDKELAPRAVAGALMAYVAVMGARNERDTLKVSWAAPDGARDAVQGIRESAPPTLCCIELDDRFMFQVMPGRGQEQSDQQKSYLLENIKLAERALTGGESSTPTGGPAGETAGDVALARGEHIVLWEDKSTLSTVATSQHYLAVMASEPRRVLDASRVTSHMDHAARLPLSMANNSERLELTFKWVGGTDDGRSFTYQNRVLSEVSPRYAADREMSMQCGYGTSQEGRPWDATTHSWCRLAFAVGGPGWDAHVADEIVPQLRFSWAANRLHMMKPTAEVVVARALAAQRLRQGDGASTLAGVGKGDAGGGGAGIETSELLMLECFCGEAPLAGCARDSMKMRVFGLDRDRKKVWQHWNEGLSEEERRAKCGQPSCTGERRNASGGQCGCKRLHEDELLEMEFLDLPLLPDELSALIGASRVGWVHFGIECDSFSHLGGENHRNLSTNWMGDSELAYKSNVEVQHLVALCYMLRRRNPHVLFSIENPDAALVHHPLIVSLVEADEADGGLGMLLMNLSYCVFDLTSPQKPSVFWGNNVDMYADFVQTLPPSAAHPNGKALLRRRCGRDACDCGDFGRHLRSQRRSQTRGQGHYRNTETYPIQLCEQICRSMHIQMRRLRKIETTEVGEDKHYGFCCRYSIEDGAEVDRCRFRSAPLETHPSLQMCYGCPRTFHEQCIPEHTITRENGAMLCNLCAPVGWQALLIHD